MAKMNVNFNSSLTNSNDYIEILKEDSKSLENHSHAVHCCLFAKSLDDTFNHAILMQMREDGTIGFPGGYVDEGEDILEALNRELWEEINLDLPLIEITNHNYLVSHRVPSVKCCLHFYAKEVTMEEFIDIEQNARKAKHFGKEVYGIFRVPFKTMKDGCRGFPQFLDNNFVGNSKNQLLYSLGVFNLLSIDEIFKALKTNAGVKPYI